jgi:vesicle-fusing ATPase
MQSLENRTISGAARITPGLTISDPFAAYWVAQVNLRLRREIAWCWFQRSQQISPAPGLLPPLADAAAENLDLVRYENQRLLFFQQDTAAAYLTEEMAKLDAGMQRPPQVESFWRDTVDLLQLDDVACFVLALALAYRVDAAIGQLCAACMNDNSRPYPSLALAQHLWDEPAMIMHCADPAHPLYRHGLLRNMQQHSNHSVWLSLLDCSTMLAKQFIDPDADLPRCMSRTQLSDESLPGDDATVDDISVARIKAASHRRPQLVPLLGNAAAGFENRALMLSRRLGHELVSLGSHMMNEPSQLAAAAHQPSPLAAAAHLCRIRGYDVYLPDAIEWNSDSADAFKQYLDAYPIPINWYLPLTDKNLLHRLPTESLVPEISLPVLGFQQRVRCFKQQMNYSHNISDAGIELCAQRFRFEERMIVRVTRALANLQQADDHSLLTACSHEASLEFNDLAQPVQPRFHIDEVVLPEKQKNQYLDIVHAMRNLTLVHHHWGTARAWNESGLSVLFCGPPGTGKTMAAEALSQGLGLPMYRIDLSQVVNKYIGETEKNLRRIFNAAEMTDCILFFDEADAIFGKRTDVKDAHDRFANIEISYLLERMERFKGLAILATNRRRDLDDAFMRRLRHVIEFPVPELAERRQIWSQVFPGSVDTSELDMNYLARQFKLSGGHIRSIAFNTCLRSADVDMPDKPRKVSMQNTLRAVRQELAKMERATSDELFGEYAQLLGGEDR